MSELTTTVCILQVVNGDIVDPYSAGDSESDIGRVDSEVLHKEKERHGRRKSKDEKQKRGSSTTRDRSRHRSPASSSRHRHPSDVTMSEYDDDSDDSYLPTRHHDDVVEVDGKSRPNRSGNPPVRVSTDNDESDCIITDYQSDANTLKRQASLKKAERNLSRIKRSDSSRRESSSKSTAAHVASDADTYSRGGGSSSSASSDVKTNHRSSSKSSKTARSLTMPRSSSRPREEKALPKKSSTSVRVKKSTDHSTQVTPSDAEAYQKPSVSSRTPPASRRRSSKRSPEKSKPSSSNSTPVAEPVNGNHVPPSSSLQPQHHSSSRRKSFDGKEGRSRAPSSSSSHKSPPVARKTESSVVKKSPSNDNVLLCDGAAQTVVSGTLTRQKKVDAKSPPPAPAPVVDEKPADRLKEEEKPQAAEAPVQPAVAPTAPPNFDPTFLHAFHQFMQQQQPPPPPPSDPYSIPPHLAHQLYYAGYYAGLSRAPPNPPAFVMQPPQGGQRAPAAAGIPSLYSHPPPPTAFYDPSYSVAPVEHHQAPPPSSDDFYSEQFQPDDMRNQLSPHHSVSHHTSPMESAANSYIDEARFSSKETLDSTFNRSEKDLSTVEADPPTLPSPDSKSEVEVAANPKGGVMIYVRSQTNSPRESISESHQDRMSEKSEGSRRSTHSNRSSTTTRASCSETSGSRRSLHSIKSSKSNRSSSRKASTPNLERKSIATPTAISEENLNSLPPPLNHNNRVLTNSELQLHDALSGDDTLPSASTRDDQVLDESGACHEEIILELTKAPLATMEDDTDGCR